MKVHFSVNKIITSLNYHRDFERVSLGSMALLRKKKKGGGRVEGGSEVSCK